MVISEIRARDRILLLRDDNAQHLGRTFQPFRREELRDALRSATMDLWQAEWDAADTGRLTHKFFPSVMARVELHLPLNRRITRAATGHFLNCAGYRARILKLQRARHSRSPDHLLSLLPLPAHRLTAADTLVTYHTLA
ncbi:uncharacterized protein LOC103518657 isoform X3 [Diaphorina citri]|uniref:Uncharacterized protein LOC103518657 isoform X2 n=1 Tax=Diaphorina citri TaxID=121845 RepID=A0A3Q0JCF2_DIACI|nr:uncharacterized protein LOC103518657 isoform X2 [Diaphorina citri]XP_026686192.1 uncharacterized protein LOC103518657 isoform X3 [Diaphorina citri]